MSGTMPPTPDKPSAPTGRGLTPKEFDHIIYPRHINQDNHLDPDEWADTGKDTR